MIAGRGLRDPKGIGFYFGFCWVAVIPVSRLFASLGFCSSDHEGPRQSADRSRRGCRCEHKRGMGSLGSGGVSHFTVFNEGSRNVHRNIGRKQGRRVKRTGGKGREGHRPRGENYTGI